VSIFLIWLFDTMENKNQRDKDKKPEINLFLLQQAIRFHPDRE